MSVTPSPIKKSTHSLLDDITPLILCFNEAPNIGRVLAALTWARRIVVVDSFSTDETEAICRSFENVEFFQRKFDDASSQDNFGLTLVETDWVLSMDSDYVLTPALIEEISHLVPSADGYFIPFKYCVHGRPLRASILPPRCSLYRRAKAHYEQDGHTQRVAIDGPTLSLTNLIHHDDRKSFTRWLWAQDRYTQAEAAKLLGTPRDKLSLNDRIRMMKAVAPWLVPLYVLTVKLGLLDGWAGLFYAYQRSLAETALAIRLIEMQKLEASKSRE